MTTLFIFPVYWSPPLSDPPYFAPIDSGAVLLIFPIFAVCVLGLPPSTEIVNRLVVKVQTMVCHEPLLNDFVLNADFAPEMPAAKHRALPPCKISTRQSCPSDDCPLRIRS